MKRTFTILAVTVVAAVAANAGQIQIGGQTGLTSSYITSHGGTTTGSFEVNYQTSVFQNAVPTGTPYAGYNPSSTTAGSTINVTNGSLTGSAFAAPDGVTFSMIADTSGTANSWAALTTSQTLTIPIGIFDVTDIATILTDYYGLAGATNTEVFFNFGTGTNPTSVSEVVGVKLQNAGTAGSAASGQIGSAMTCDANLSAPAAQFTACQGLAGGALAPSSVLTAYSLLTSTANNSSVFSSGTTSNLTVDTAYAYGPTNYTSTGASREFNGTSGTNQLDAQDFIFGSSFQGLTLMSMGILNPAYLAAPVGGSSIATVDSLTAITVNSSADLSSTPEPSTWMLFLGGIALIGFGRLRRAYN